MAIAACVLLRVGDGDALALGRSLHALPGPATPSS
jgi:hypothetical protein